MIKQTFTKLKLIFILFAFILAGSSCAKIPQEAPLTLEPLQETIPEQQQSQQPQKIAERPTIHTTEQPDANQAKDKTAVNLNKETTISRKKISNSRKQMNKQTQQQRKLTLSELIQKYPDHFVKSGSTKRKQIALTFDDCPDILYTPAILDILKEHQIKATFFVVGSRAEKHPQLVKRMVREVHTIGNHSYNHALLTKLSTEKFQFQINKTQNILQQIIGYLPKFVRPPYGELDESQLQWLIQQKLTTVFWNVDSQDWRQLSAEKVTANVLNHIRPGAIVLQHSGGGDGQDLSGTVEALPRIIQQLKKNGYQFVTIPNLLHLPQKI